ncbi:hypothetical protein Dsin_018980 [Dipteronia sinensis]|uniref:Reverse transcriptase domain-containing protein n=1 Tax=Dipteronia sinensis TaxID=43782 RepID=A0AAE0A761_9ROSI|nr:hypothetical protein Dsin_018980 [Dipteronia sinensis]
MISRKHPKTGFHAMFFQKLKSVIGKDFSDVCLRILNDAASIREFNFTNVILIPKLHNPTSPNDFWTIALCSVVYKTVAKILESRLKNLLPELISPHQSAFVPGRQIFDNVLVAFESLHSIARKKSGKKELMALKLDMKAFSCLISGSEKNGRGLGFKCCRCAPIISHMFFADDSILFCKASKENNLCIKKILETYEHGSGQQINLHKSSITFSPIVDDLTRSGIQQQLDLLVKGLRWGVGDGNKIRVFKDQWTPRPLSFKPTTHDPGADMKVVDLLDNDSRMWDIGKLNEVLLPIDKDIVLTIPISWRKSIDFLLWHFDKSCVYTINSGYRVACTQNLEALVSNSSISCNWLKTLWSLNLPPKVHIFCLKGLFECAAFDGNVVEKGSGGFTSLSVLLRCP